ncbi:unnamed protein product [Amoebophrya sp. A120]|nr:unnamed protein product [Amoebophrya sp. A120]|eukprot:GSA120T00004686001.1
MEEVDGAASSGTSSRRGRGWVCTRTTSTSEPLRVGEGAAAAMRSCSCPSRHNKVFHRGRRMRMKTSPESRLHGNDNYSPAPVTVRGFSTLLTATLSSCLANSTLASALLWWKKRRRKIKTANRGGGGAAVPAPPKIQAKPMILHDRHHSWRFVSRTTYQQFLHFLLCSCLSASTRLIYIYLLLHHPASIFLFPTTPVNAQMTKPPTTSTLALSNGVTIYHPILQTNQTRCWPLKRSLCDTYRHGNPWSYGEFLNTSEWLPHRPVKSVQRFVGLKTNLPQLASTVSVSSSTVAKDGLFVDASHSLGSNGDIYGDPAPVAFGTAIEYQQYTAQQYLFTYLNSFPVLNNVKDGELQKVGAAGTGAECFGVMCLLVEMSTAATNAANALGTASTTTGQTMLYLNALPLSQLLAMSGGAATSSGGNNATTGDSTGAGTSATHAAPEVFEKTSLSLSSVVHRRLNQDCIPGVTGVLLEFPVPDKDTRFEIYWGDGRLLLPFDRNLQKVPNLGLADNPLTACHPNIEMIVRETDPNADRIIPQNLPTFDIGPMEYCTHEKAMQQCCWIECGYYIMDSRSNPPNGPLCWFALEYGELPLGTSKTPEYTVWRVQRVSAKVREDTINDEMENPTGMLSFGGIVQDSLDSIDLEADYPKQRLHAGVAKTYQPCAYCSVRQESVNSPRGIQELHAGKRSPMGDYNEETGKMSVKIVWEPHVIEPLLQLGGFPTFDHWVQSGNGSSGYLYNLEQIPLLTEQEANNLTNRDQVMRTQIQFNNLQKPGLRLFVRVYEQRTTSDSDFWKVNHTDAVSFKDDQKVEQGWTANRKANGDLVNWIDKGVFPGYFLESKFQESAEYYPVNPFFDPENPSKNWNCYAGRSVPVPDLIPWSRANAELFSDAQPRRGGGGTIRNRLGFLFTITTTIIASAIIPTRP